MIDTQRYKNAVATHAQHRPVGPMTVLGLLQPLQHLLDLGGLPKFGHAHAQGRRHLPQGMHRPVDVMFLAQQGQDRLLRMLSRPLARTLRQGRRGTIRRDPQTQLQGENAGQARFQGFIADPPQGDVTKQRPQTMAILGQVTPPIEFAVVANLLGARLRGRRLHLVVNPGDAHAPHLPQHLLQVFFELTGCGRGGLGRQEFLHHLACLTKERK